MRALLAGALVALLMSGCGEAEPDDARDRAPARTGAPTGSPTGLGSAPVVALTAAEICAAVPAAVVTEAIASEVGAPEPGTSRTAQCSYPYGGDSSTLSNVTIAAMAPADVGDRGLAEAFDYVVELNASGAATPPVDLPAGDQAIRISGEALHLGVVATGGHLLTVIATPDVAAAQVDALVESVGAALA